MRLTRYDRLCKKHPTQWRRVKDLFYAYQKQASKIKLSKASYRIPKKIHMIWFGSKPPVFVKTMFESWKKFHPTWKVKLWNEEEAKGYGLKNNEAFTTAKNYGEKSDIFRYELLEREGGIYVDTDFECLKPFDELCQTADFFTGLAYATGEPFVYNGIIGASPHHPIMKRAVEQLSKGNGDSSFQRILYTTGPHFFTKSFMETVWPANNAPGNIGTVVAFPISYFYPFPDTERGNFHDTELAKKTWVCADTYAIHYWKISWQ
jgi:inositol phosphorylceramide mannosyltransferase catalytic subunit